MKNNNIDEVALITGATSGIGKQTALSLAKQGYYIIITGRNISVGENVAKQMQMETNNSQIEFVQLNISTIAEISKFTDNIKSKYKKIDILINNAGSAAQSKILTDEGIELNFFVNVLAPYLISRNLLEVIKKSESPKIISLTGGSHNENSKINLENMQAEVNFDGLNSYSHSKLLMMAVMNYFSKLPETKNIAINVCYPGQASTNMTQSVTKNMFPKSISWFVFPIFRFFVRDDQGKSAKIASKSTIDLATNDKFNNISGIYLDKKCRLTKWPQDTVNEQIQKEIIQKIEKLEKTIA